MCVSSFKSHYSLGTEIPQHVALEAVVRCLSQQERPSQLLRIFTSSNDATQQFSPRPAAAAVGEGGGGGCFAARSPLVLRILYDTECLFTKSSVCKLY